MSRGTLAAAARSSAIQSRGRFSAALGGRGSLCRDSVGQVQVAMYVYNTDGNPVGFVFETSIYDIDGTPLGRIVGSRVHRFDGTYVGEWFKDMVVRRPLARARIIPAAPTPPRRPPADASYKLRAVVDYGYPDAFPLLRQGAADDLYLSEAAE